MSAYVPGWVHVYLGEYMCTWVSTCVPGWVHVYLVEYMCTWVSTYIFGWVHVYLGEYMCTWVSTCVPGFLNLPGSLPQYIGAYCWPLTVILTETYTTLYWLFLSDLWLKSQLNRYCNVMRKLLRVGLMICCQCSFIIVDMNRKSKLDQKGFWSAILLL